MTVLWLSYGASVSNPLGLHAGIWGLILNASAFVIISLALQRKDADVVERFAQARRDYTAEYHPEQLEDDVAPSPQVIEAR